MKKKIVIIVLILIVLALVAIFAVPRTLLSDPESVNVHTVKLGLSEISAPVDSEELLFLLSQAKGTKMLASAAPYQITDDMIQIDGVDHGGPVHIVLSSTVQFYYRDAASCFKIVDGAELHAAVLELLTD